MALAKSYAGEACLAVARKAHQIFGAISYCDEPPLHHFHKRILTARLAFGDPAHHQELIARHRPGRVAGDRMAPRSRHESVR